MKILDFRENLGFSRKSRIFAKILDFRENLGFSRKSQKISNFCSLAPPELLSNFSQPNGMVNVASIDRLPDQMLTWGII